MSTNFVHVLTVIGEAASEVESACDDLLGRRVESESNSYSSDDWSDRDHCDLAELCETLVGTSHHLPVLYSARYLDGWSTGGLQYAPLEWPDGRERLILGDRYDLAFYPSRYRDTFLPRLKAMRRRKVYREQSEYRWHADHMKEAIEAALWLDAPFLVLAISQFLEPTRHDEDIKAALRASSLGDDADLVDRVVLGPADIPVFSKHWRLGARPRPLPPSPRNEPFHARRASIPRNSLRHGPGRRDVRRDRPPL